MVENIVSSYKCPFCAATSIGEKNIDIVGAAGNTVNIDMHCPSCNKHFMAKTEIVHMEVGNMTKEKMNDITQALAAIKGKLGGDIDIEADIISEDSRGVDQILDTNIVDLQKEMQQSDFSASDLFFDESEQGPK